MNQGRRGRRRVAIAALAGAAGVALLVLGTGSLWAGRAGARADFGSVDGVAATAMPAPTVPRPPATKRPAHDSPRPAATVDQKHNPRPATPARAADGLPVRLRLPSLQVDAPVGPVVAHDGALQVPEDPSALGWWTGGVRPGTGQGSVVIDGHVDSAATGPGALYRLTDLPSGAPVEISTATGTTLRYRVYGRRHYVKTDGLPPSLFTRTGPARLLLITCGGAFDRSSGSYADNIVVFARPA